MPRITKNTWTEEQDAIMHLHYANTTNADLAKLVGRTESAVSARAFILKLFETEAFHLEHAKKGWYAKGTVPPNKGKKQTEYMSAEAIERTKATRFNKGNKPHNCYDEVGKITIRHDHAERGGKPYKYICLAIGSWRPYHQHLWEQQNGKVPKNHCLWFKDGDSLNVDLYNLECITRKENILRNNDLDNPSDKKVAAYLAISSKKLDRDLQQEYLKHPELIQAKKTQFIINRKIRQHGQKQNSRP